MNNRDYKIFSKDCQYHIYNRGNNKEKIFLNEEDYKKFINGLSLCLGHKVNVRSKIVPFEKGSFRILAYCLMDNHFHFIIEQCKDYGINELIQKLCTSYVKYFNKKYNHIGNLFQDTFKAKLIEDDAYLMYLSAYIHNNPKRNLENYKYSSANEYLISEDGICDKTKILALFHNDIDAYAKFLKEQLYFSETIGRSIFEV